MEHFKLEDKIPVKCEYDEWEEWLQEGDFLVGITSKNGITVSTMFLGISTGVGNDGHHYVFETMVRGGEYHHYTDRYATWEDAEAGHDCIVKMVFEING